MPKSLIDEAQRLVDIYNDDETELSWYHTGRAFEVLEQILIQLRK